MKGEKTSVDGVSNISDIHILKSLHGGLVRDGGALSGKALKVSGTERWGLDVCLDIYTTKEYTNCRCKMVVTIVRN